MYFINFENTAKKFFKLEPFFRHGVIKGADRKTRDQAYSTVIVK